ncbi:MAG TPA: biotin carboxylase N-terminal domain-containing protein [Gaiellaceae bacterium]|nr:biotin carboxylase N-terminal domain-containing protein [Gaiellaceae bacterium]
MAIRKLLVANRGEIAVRIFRTCRELGTGTVAVAAPDDEGALHTRTADETVRIASYLHSEEHIRAALSAGADAIHPGYGFLAENAGFAAAVEAAGLVFVGPSPESLAAGGDKLAAKRAAREAGVPVLEEGEPSELGFPLLVKAAAGGGGRGMRVVRAAGELDEALDAAGREAQAAFGDGTVFCERYLERPRHVEIQLLGDGTGAAIALGERECSVQRRHQKVLEESPSPALDAALRAAMSDAAVAFAQAIRYRSAGTAEFVLDGRDFFFLELNGRIQVEHPVTELVTGLDLVAAQLELAEGGPLPGAPGLRGHAVEVRLYAEDPRTFLPQTGRLERLRLPDGVRVDAGVEEGDEVGIAYDPMIAKLVAHGDTRDEALDRLAAALAATEVGGVVTNLPFLRWLVAHPVVHAGETTTAFLVEHPPLSEPRPPLPAVWGEGFRLNLPAPPPHGPPDETPAGAQDGGQEHSAVTAPMPGTVLRVLVAAGDRVEARQPLVVLEAMKMETPLVSPYDGVVLEVHVAEGDRVAGGAVVVELEE